ncbi:MAG: VOC family protein [Actinomycetota bacterium]
MSTLVLSHILHRVGDLPRAVAEAETAGFQVEWGSDPEVAHNALVWFARGAFLELYHAPPFDESTASLVEEVAGSGAVLRSRRWGAMADGWCDYAVETADADLGAVAARCAADDIALGPAFNPSRALPGGGRVSWHLAFPDDGDLPFVMSAYAPPQRPGAVAHANGATEITSITVAHPRPDEYRRHLARYVGTSSLDGVIIERGTGAGATITGVTAAGLDAPARFGVGTIDPAG